MVGEYTVYRDFIYLDWERIRSIAAQILKGIPENKQFTDGQENIEKGEIGLNVPFIKGSAGQDVRYFHSDGETRSLHHHIYSLTEEELTENNFIHTIDSTTDMHNWTENNFYDGQFVKIKGFIRLMDYRWMLGWMGNFENTIKTIQYYELSAIKDLQKKAEKKKEQEKSFKEIKELRISDMQKLIQQIFGEIIKIKIVPNIDYPNNLFVGLADPKNFNEMFSAIYQKYGCDINANWTTFGQINFPKKGENEQILLPSGNQIEDSLENVILALDAIQHIASSVKFPAVSITPLSIYRECAPNQ